MRPQFHKEKRWNITGPRFGRRDGIIRRQPEGPPRGVIFRSHGGHGEPQGSLKIRDLEFHGKNMVRYIWRNNRSLEPKGRMQIMANLATRS
jgi:hypothetical protein